MRVLVCGSRTWNDVELIAQALQKLPSDTTLLHGDAIGADTIAHVVAESLGFEVVKFPVSQQDWDTYGKSAGPRRNKEMLLKGEPDFIIAFLDTLTTSPGTLGMIELAESFGKRVVLCKKDCWEDMCRTCGKAYDRSNLTTCSAPFHRCRQCTYQDGYLLSRCKEHTDEEV